MSFSSNPFLFQNFSQAFLTQKNNWSPVISSSLNLQKLFKNQEIRNKYLRTSESCKKFEIPDKTSNPQLRTSPSFLETESTLINTNQSHYTDRNREALVTPNALEKNILFIRKTQSVVKLQKNQRGPKEKQKVSKEFKPIRTFSKPQNAKEPKGKNWVFSSETAKGKVFRSFAGRIVKESDEPKSRKSSEENLSAHGIRIQTTGPTEKDMSNSHSSKKRKQKHSSKEASPLYNETVDRKPIYQVDEGLETNQKSHKAKKAIREKRLDIMGHIWVHGREDGDSGKKSIGVSSFKNFSPTSSHASPQNKNSNPLNFRSIEDSPTTKIKIGFLDKSSPDSPLERIFHMEKEQMNHENRLKRNEQFLVTRKFIKSGPFKASIDLGLLKSTLMDSPFQQLVYGSDFSPFVPEKHSFELKSAENCILGLRKIHVLHSDFSRFGYVKCCEVDIPVYGKIRSEKGLKEDFLSFLRHTKKKMKLLDGFSHVFLLNEAPVSNLSCINSTCNVILISKSPSNPFVHAFNGFHMQPLGLIPPKLNFFLTLLNTCESEKDLSQMIANKELVRSLVNDNETEFYDDFLLLSDLLSLGTEKSQVNNPNEQIAKTEVERIIQERQAALKEKSDKNTIQRNYRKYLIPDSLKTDDHGYFYSQKALNAKVRGMENYDRKPGQFSSQLDPLLNQAYPQRKSKIPKEQDELTLICMPLLKQKKRTYLMPYRELGRLEDIDKMYYRQISKEYPPLSSMNIPKIEHETKMCRAELHKLYCRFKALLQMAAADSRLCNYNTKDGVNVGSFQKSIMSLAASHEEVVRRLFYSGIIENLSVEKISWGRFLYAMKSLRAHNSKEKIDLFFKLMDWNGNGTISWEEVRDFCLKSLEIAKISKNDAGIDKLAGFLTNLLFKMFQAKKEDDLSLEKIRDSVLANKEDQKLFLMLCGTDNDDDLDKIVMEDNPTYDVRTFNV